MNTRDTHQVLEDITQVSPRLNLLTGIRARVEKRRQVTMRLRLAALMAAIALLAAALSQPAVASALKRLVGFIPGVGVVDQSVPLRALAGPVSDARDGYSLVVEQAVLDASRTVLDVRIGGPFATWEDPSLKPRMCMEPARLVLPGGEVLQQGQSAGSFYGGEYIWQLTFGAVPPGVERAELVFPCLPETPAGEGPINWSIPLAFAVAPNHPTVYPIIDAGEAGFPELPAPVEEPREGLLLRGFAALEEGYFLESELRWVHEPGAIEVELFPDSYHLYDQAGSELSVWAAGQDRPAAPSEQQSMPLRLQTGTIPADGSVRLVVDYLAVTTSASAEFAFDAGIDPQPGQIWEINQDLKVEGYDLIVRQAEYIQPAPDQPAMLMLYLEAGPEVLKVTAIDTQHAIFGTGGSPNSEFVPFRAAWYYQDGFPGGTIRVQISTITVRRDGPWSMEWSPSSPGEAGSPPQAAVAASAPGVCMHELEWIAELPAGLGGRVATMEHNGDTFEIYISDLDGGNRFRIGPGIFPDLSPDGRRVAYTGSDGGLHIRDLVSGADIVVTGTIQDGVYVHHPRWSPDGRMIAFQHVEGHAADIHIVDASGANLQPLLESADQEYLLGWSPDSRYISYIRSDDEGASLEIINMEDRSAASSQNRLERMLPDDWSSASLSPDGSRLLYVTRQGVHLYTFVTGETVLLFGSQSPYASQIQPAWSPDGEWVALTHWEGGNTGTQRLVLLHPGTCRAMRMEWSQSGWLASWVQE